MQTLPIKLMLAALICCLSLYLISLGIKGWLYLNVSKSLERGIYLSADDLELGKGKIIALKIPKQIQELKKQREWLRYKDNLLKIILGVEGDEVCYSDSKVTVGDTALNILREDHQGRKLPHQEPGCFRVKPGELFVAGISSDSFDSRYFGTVSKDEVLAVVKKIVGFDL